MIGIIDSEVNFKCYIALCYQTLSPGIEKGDASHMTFNFIDVYKDRGINQMNRDCRKIWYEYNQMNYIRQMVIYHYYH